MNIREIMERAGINETGRAIAYIKDGLEELNLISETHINTERIDITKDQRYYTLPSDSIKVLDVRCKNHRNSSDEYRSIPRLIQQPAIEDTDGS